MYSFGNKWYMKYKSELERLSVLPYFDNVTIDNLLGISRQNLQMFTTRAVARGQFIRLKRGIYVTQNYYKLEKGSSNYPEFLSNMIYAPSYLSLEYILQKYSVLTESVFAYTALTVKKTVKITNPVGNFLYTNINKKQFTGFNIVSKGKYQIYEATLAKALYDYLYFFIKSRNIINKELIESLRLNLDEVDTNTWDEFKSYVNSLGGRKMKKVAKILCNQ